MPIFLIGYMASGKTTIGKELADYLNISHIDIDNLIEKKTGMTIFDLFNKKGESFFRKVERDILRSYIYNSKLIVSTGGGTPCFYNNQKFLNSKGCTVYLKITVKEIMKRINLNKKRPIIYNNHLTLKKFITQQLLEREKYYLQSNYVIQSDNISIDLILNKINQLKCIR